MRKNSTDHHQLIRGAHTALQDSNPTPSKQPDPQLSLPFGKSPVDRSQYSKASTHFALKTKPSRQIPQAFFILFALALLSFFSPSLYGGCLSSEEPSSSSPCSSSQSFLDASSYSSLNLPSSANLFVCVSFSIPQETWLRLSKELESLGGVFIVRGFPQGSFQTFLEKVMELRQAGVLAPIEVDPDQFEAYGVTAVPTFVLLKEEGFEKVVGNVTLSYAMEKMGVYED